MTLEEGQSITVRFDSVAPRGDAIASEGLPKPIYASGVIPGEEARVKIRKIRRNWIAVDVEEVTEPSPHRATPPCPLFEGCSGCQFQHVQYEHQLDLKRRMVKEQLAKFGGFEDAPVQPVIGAESPWNYRNHARFTVKEGKLGFVRRFRRQFFEVPECKIMEHRVNDVLAKVQGKLDTATQCNIRVGAPEDQVMIQPALDLAHLGLETGQKHITEQLHGKAFLVAASSFFQVNRRQAERLIDVVRSQVSGDPETVVADAYAGVGTFAALLADSVAKVVAIEESAPAIEAAKKALADLDNVELICARAEELLPTLEQRIDVVILDPPRSGCLPAALEAVAKFKPRRVVYVSCDPSSLGRDLQVLCGPDGAFDLVSVQPVDMFPQTHHVESVATLDLRGQ
ncbi:MAG: methyltransferase domain-containing protein [Myxococcota bacterium]